MGVLDQQVSKRKGYKVVGVSLPPRDHNYLTLYTIAKGETKTKIIKGFLDKWIEESKKKQNEVALIDEIIRRLLVKFKAEITNNPRLEFVHFIDTIKDELLQKGVNETYVKLIITGLRDGKNEETRNRKK